MGVFHGLTAGVIWLGTIILALTIYRVVFGREQQYTGALRPIGALASGFIGGVVSSAVVTLAIAAVFEPGSLAAMGWVTGKPERYSAEWLSDLFVETRFGWAYILSGTAFGVGLAMVTNKLRAAPDWERYLARQTRVASFGQCAAIVKGTTGIVVRHCLPLVLALVVGGTLEYLVCDPPLEKPSKWGTWETPSLFLALSIAADCGSKLIGGVFAIVGLGLGVVVLRHGVHLDPRRG